MVSCTSCMIVTSVLVGVLAYLSYQPLPHSGFKNHWVVTINLSVFKFIGMLSYCLEVLGVCDRYDIQHLALKFMGNTAPYKDHVQTEELLFDGVRVLMFSPIGRKKSDAPLPGLVHFHGGGWIMGSPDSLCDLPMRYAKELNAVVVSVDYRLAPEHKFPAAINDCLAATVHFMKNSLQYNVDPNRITIAGESAGGNLAASVTLKLSTDASLQPLKSQMLLYPILQGFDLQLPSYQQGLDGVLNSDIMAYSICSYALGHHGPIEKVKKNLHTSAKVKQIMASSFLNHTIITSQYHTEGYTPPNTDFGDEDLWREFEHVLLDPLFSPLMAKDLSTLPPTYVWTGQYDILRDEGILYVKRMREAGVSVVHHHYKYGFHAMTMYADQLEEAEEVLREAETFMRENI